MVGVVCERVSRLRSVEKRRETHSHKQALSLTCSFKGGGAVSRPPTCSKPILKIAARILRLLCELDDVSAKVRAHDAELIDLRVRVVAIIVKRRHHRTARKRAEIATLGGRRAGAELLCSSFEGNLAVLDLLLNVICTAAV